jgi:hypothetical protein
VWWVDDVGVGSESSVKLWPKPSQAK